MQSERRGTPRIAFAASAVITDTETARVLTAPTDALSRFGCFVRTTTPFPQGTRIKVRIACSGAAFDAFGRAAYVTEEGMGIVFSVVEADDLEILEQWLARIPSRNIRSGEHVIETK